MSAREPESLRTLRKLADEAATGELVCATSEAEVHVHLQAGRVAWATSSAARFTFARYVVEQCDIDATAFRELVHECQREHKPLGETLLEWGVASEEQLRAALSKQIVDALETLRSSGRTETIFLQRGSGYRSYNRALTFAIDDVCGAPPHRENEARLPRVSSFPPPADLYARLRDLLRHEQGINWIEHHLRGRVSKRLPVDDERESGIEALVCDVMRDEVSFVAVRGASENLIGVELEEPHGSVWCGVDLDIVLGAMITVLRERLRSEDIARPSLPGQAGGPFTVARDRGLRPALLSDVMTQTPVVNAVGLVDGDGEGHWLARREGQDAPAVEHRIAVLSGFLRGIRERTGDAADAPRMQRHSMVASTPSGWYFGGELADGTARDLWLVLEPSATQGIGWALLVALLRETSITPRELYR